MSLLYIPSSQFDPNVEMDDSLAKSLQKSITDIKSEIAKLDVDLRDCSYSEAVQRSARQGCNSSTMAKKQALLVPLKRYTKFLRFHPDHPSPIRRLPNEILAEIFSHVLHSLHPPSPDLDTPTFGDASLAPVRQMRGCILCVCWRWRRTSISEPRLWQVVKLTIGSPLVDLHPEAKWQHIQDRIAWAGSLNLHLVVYHRKSSASINDDQAFKILCGLLPRLLSLHVHPEEGLIIDPIRLNDPPAMYSNLKQICVEVRTVYAATETRGWCENLLSNTPEVVWLDLPTPENMSYSPHVLSNLQFLSLRRAEPDDVVTILDCAGRLLSLHVQCITDSHDTPLPGKTGIVQSQLSRLRIDKGYLSSSLPSLTLPALRHLTFPTGCDWPTPGAPQFFERSQCKLVTLDTPFGYDYRDSSFTKTLQTQETLTSLIMSFKYSDHPVPDDFILSLAIPGSLPKLAVCHFTIHHSQIPILQNMLSARLQAQQAGKAVRMDDWVVTYSHRSRHTSVLEGIIRQWWNSGSNLRVESDSY